MLRRSQTAPCVRASFPFPHEPPFPCIPHMEFINLIELSINFFIKLQTPRPSCYRMLNKGH